METVEDEDAIEVVRENKGPERLSKVIFRLIEHPADFRWRFGETEPPVLKVRENGAWFVEPLLGIDTQPLNSDIDAFFSTRSGLALRSV